MNQKKTIEYMDNVGENEFRNLAHSCREISNQLELLSPTLGNVVNVLQTNQNIANVINEMRNDMNAGFQRINQRIDRVENRLIQRISTVQNRLTRRINAINRNTDEIKNMVKKTEKLSLIRSINSTCFRANSKIHWLKFRGRRFPHEVSTLSQLDRLDDQQIQNILQYYDLPRTANETTNRRNLLNYIGVPNHLNE